MAVRSQIYITLPKPANPSSSPTNPGSGFNFVSRKNG